MSRWRTKAGALPLCVLMAVAVPALAQPKAGATVSGTVVDESGAILPGASVQLTGPGVNRFQSSGPEGTYTFTVVPAGTYRVAATLSGFGSASHEATVPASGTIQVPPLALKLAVRGEEIVVTA